MDKFEKAIKNDKKGVLLDVYNASYSLIPVSKTKMIEIADNVNKELGYTLFASKYYPRLCYEFDLITRMAQMIALTNK